MLGELASYVVWFVILVLPLYGGIVRTIEWFQQQGR